MLFVLHETTHLIADPAAADDRAEMRTAAVAAGCRVVDFQKSEEGNESIRQQVMAAIPPEFASAFIPALWLGFIPSDNLYETVYEAARDSGLYLINTPEEHALAMEFDRCYPFLEGITPETVILNRPDAWRTVEAQIDYPVFVRGAVRSRKTAGWRSCVAENREELIPLINYLFASPFRSRGSVLVRRLVSLRHTRRTPQGFPKGREYRVFLYRSTVLGWGYYWDGDDPLRELNQSEQDTVLALAQEAAKLLAVSFLAVDIGQTQEGNWLVIEVGDAQFAGHAQTPLASLWTAIVQQCSSL